jgi:hypothetical protein
MLGWRTAGRMRPPGASFTVRDARKNALSNRSGSVICGEFDELGAWYGLCGYLPQFRIIAGLGSNGVPVRFLAPTCRRYNLADRTPNTQNRNTPTISPLSAKAGRRS